MLAKRPLFAALAVSLLAHLVFLATTGSLWVAMPEEIGFPIEASLAPIPESRIPVPEVVAPSPVKPAAQPRPFTPAEPTPVPVVEPLPLPQPPMPVIERPPATTPAPVALPTAPVSEPIPVVHHEPVAPVDEARPEPVKPARPALRRLPDRIEIRYAVQYGEGGFTAGEARYLWESRNGRYTLVSTVEAKGLASLFISGRITQTSEGSVNDGGLQPEQYTENKGERRQEPARFIWPENRLVLSGSRGSVPLQPQAQDLLSFPFHLAATARVGEAEFNQAVSNGRKLQFYHFRVIGEESLALANRTVDTLHLKGHREGAGDLDVWLDHREHFLPVQVRTIDQRGKQVTLIADKLIYRNLDTSDAQE
jgi:hypothetical protein